MHANRDECEAAGLDHKEVERIAKGLSRYGEQAKKLGITVFGGSGSGTLRFTDETDCPLIVADIFGGWFDGGDGADRIDSDGLKRGEGSDDYGKVC